jgi:hypothetical protein
MKEYKMKVFKTLFSKIEFRIKRRKDKVFILDDFKDYIEAYDYDQVLRSLRSLVKSGQLVRIGRGIYAKTKTFSNGNTGLCAGIGELTKEALNKLGIKTDVSDYTKMYNSGLTTQVPTGRVIAVSKRVRRKIGYNGYDVEFQQMKAR